MMAKFLLLVFLVYSATMLGQTKKLSLFRERPLLLRVAYVELSKDNPPDSALENFTVSYIGTKVVMNMIFYINRDIKSFEKGNVVIRRCDDQAQEKNCEAFQTWRFVNICGLMAQKHMIWTPFVNAFQPKFQCPILKNKYHVNNGTLDVDVLKTIFASIPIENYFWRVQADGYDHNKLWFSALFGLRYVRGKA